MSGQGQTVLVALGTDHHPFGRAVAWADAWAAAHPDDTVIVQHGASAAPQRAVGHDFVAPSELGRLMREADVVITHGGPGTIAAARAAGHLPFVLPRDPRLGEHVDDHQMRFSAWAERHGLGRRCATDAELTSAVQAVAATGGTRSAASTQDGRVLESSRRLASLLDSPRRRGVAPEAPTVVYIGGFGRSGSTLLERILSSLDGTVALGEVVHLWKRGIGADERCGCGAPFSACGFWSEVGRLAFGGWDRVDLDEVTRLHASVDRQRRAPLTLVPTPPLSVRKDLIAYTSLYRAVYQAALEVSGAPARRRLEQARITGHRAQPRPSRRPARDPRRARPPRGRALVGARGRRPRGPRRRGDARFSSSSAAGLWLSNNGLVDALRLRGVPVHHVRVRGRRRSAPGHDRQRVVRPRSARIERPVDERPQDDRAGTVPLRRWQPDALQARQHDVRADQEWQRTMPAHSRWQVTALTAPLLLRYGYRL